MTSYKVGSLIGTLKILEYIPVRNGNSKFKVICVGCGTESMKWSTTVYAVNKGRLKACKVCNDRSMRRTDEWPAVIRMAISYKSNAKARGLDFDLTTEQFYNIAKNDCFYCGASPVLRRPSKSWQSTVFLSGIDRVNNEIGYTYENTVPCCYDCNRAKSDLSMSEFADWCKRLVARGFWLDKNEGLNDNN